jgi:hypothetical protein
MEVILEARNRPDVCKKYKTKLPEGYCQTRCDPCKQRTRVVKTWRKQKFEGLENVLPDGQAIEEKANLAKACADED